MSANLARPTAVRGLRLSWRRRLVYIAIAVAGAFVVVTAVFVALDVYVHRKVQYEAGVNVWGYRGDVVGRKRAGEQRIVALGGSTVFGYGLPWNESWPYYLEQKIAANAASATHRVSVVNLGIPTDSARTFVSTLDDYEYLEPDIAMFYEGYNDLGLDANPPKNSTNPAVSHYLAWRHQSPIFRWTGYFPILPLALNEKASIMLHGRAAADGEVAFRPDLATRTTAGAMKSAADITVALERRLGKLTDTDVRRSSTVDVGCGRWSQYCGAIEEAVQRALARRERVVVITQPYFSDLHVDQQHALATMMTARFGSDPRVRYINLGKLIDIRDTSVVYDGLHLTAVGNERVAEALLPTTLEMLGAPAALDAKAK
jgi:lysophospholipase L1-like esterase